MSDIRIINIINMELLKIGDNAPDFECVDNNGDIIKLTDYKGKKLVIFLTDYFNCITLISNNNYQDHILKNK